MENEEMQDQPSVMSISLKYGLFTGLVLIAYNLVIQLAGLIGNQALGYVGFIFLIVFMVLAHKAYKNEGDGYMAYGKGLGIGTMISLISGAISSIFTYVYLTFVDDSMIEILKEAQYDAMADRGLTDAEIEQAMEITGGMMEPLPMAIIGTLSMVIIGFIISLIVAAITKNTNPEMEI